MRTDWLCELSRSGQNESVPSGWVGSREVPPRRPVAVDWEGGRGAAVPHALHYRLQRVTDTNALSWCKREVRPTLTVERPSLPTLFRTNPACIVSSAGNWDSALSPGCSSYHSSDSRPLQRLTSTPETSISACLHLSVVIFFSAYNLSSVCERLPTLTVQHQRISTAT